MESETMIVVTVLMGVILVVVIYFWSKTTVTTTSMTVNSNENIAKIQLEGTKMKVESVNRKNEQDYDISQNRMKVELQGQEKQLEEQNVIQKGLTTRVALKCETMSSIAGRDFEIRKQEINADLEKHGKDLEFRDRQLTTLVGLEEHRISNQLEGIKSQVEGRKFLATKALEGMKILQEHEDDRHSATLNGTLKMHSADLGHQKEIIELRVKSSERKASSFLEYKRGQEKEITKRKEIEAEANFKTGLLEFGTAAVTAGVGVAVAGGTGGVLPMVKGVLPMVSQILGSTGGNRLSTSTSTRTGSGVVIEEVDDDTNTRCTGPLQLLN